MKATIFTIGRQYGSGGHEIGEKLAGRLHIPFYDNELISLAAKKSGMSEEIFEQVDEKPTNSFLYSLAMGAFNFGSMTGFADMSINDKLFLAQSEVIEEAAKNGSCVFVGRCADYILRDFDNVVNIYCYGKLEDRVARIQKVLNIKEHKEAAEVVSRKDKTTANFYNYYSNQKWGQAENYDLLLNTSKLPIDECVELILQYKQLYEASKK